MMLGPVLAIALALSPAIQEAPRMQHARGTFDVTVTPVQPGPDAPPDGHGRMSLAKVFHGDLVGMGEGEMLGQITGDRSGAYVALERVRGTVNGRTGTFALVHRGVMEGGAQDLSIAIVPGSGTGELTGIAGVFHLTIEGGEHRYDLEYSLPGG